MLVKNYFLGSSLFYRNDVHSLQTLKEAKQKHRVNIRSNLSERNISLRLKKDKRLTKKIKVVKNENQQNEDKYRWLTSKVTFNIQEDETWKATQPGNENGAPNIKTLRPFRF